MVGLAGEGENFDGNGIMVRFQTGGGAQQVSLGQGSAGSPPQFGSLPTPPLGNRPFYPGKIPPYRSDQPCFRQKLPDLNGPAAAKSQPSGPRTTTSQSGTARTARLRTLRSKIRPFGTRREESR
jgi:phospholipid/cholesterol/gamma-HCH transport system substrate-binding protein